MRFLSPFYLSGARTTPRAFPRQSPSMARWGLRRACSILLVFGGAASCVSPVSNLHSVTLKVVNLAGNGSQGYTGDQGPAVSAQLNFPTSIALDASQNLLIADWNNHVVRRVDPGGKIITVAGRGTPGYSGDGGLAIGAELKNPNSVAVDGYGNVFISDWGNNVVRKVDGKGIITTYAGSGVTGYSGDGAQAVLARFYWPTGVALDSSGNLFISDSNNSVIRKVDARGTISTYAGTGVFGYGGDGGLAALAQFSSPGGLAIDPSGNLLVSDYNNGVIRKIDVWGKVTTLVGNGISGFSGDGGPAASAELNAPGELSTDALGNLFVADTGNHRVRRVTPLGIVTTIAGTGVQGFSGNNGLATSARFNTPTGVVVDPLGNLYIADQQNHSVRKVVLNTIAHQGLSNRPDGGSSQTPTE